MLLKSLEGFARDGICPIFEPDVITANWHRFGYDRFDLINPV